MAKKPTASEAMAHELALDGYHTPLTRAQSKLIDAAAAIMLDPEPTDADRAFLARQLVQVTLPHANPGNVPIWRRRNGRLTLTLRPYAGLSLNACGSGYTLSARSSLNA